MSTTYLVAVREVIAGLAANRRTKDKDENDDISHALIECRNYYRDKIDEWESAKVRAYDYGTQGRSRRESKRK